MARAEYRLMPLRDQIALRLLDSMLGGGTAPDNVEIAVSRAYAYGDALLERARDNWRASKGAGEGKGDTVSEENTGVSP